MTNIGQVYKYPMENQFNLKGKVEIAIMTWESSDSMKIQKISQVFLTSSTVLKSKTEINRNNGTG